MLRVALVTDQSGFDDTVDGGLQAVTKYLVDALTRRDEVELHVLCFRYGIRNRQTAAANGYTRHDLPGARFGALTGFRTDQETLDSCLDLIQPDIVHGQGADHNGILVARSQCASVITIHGIIAEEARFFTNLARRTRHRVITKMSDRYCIKRARHTILISPYVAEYYEGRLAGKQYLIPNPIADGFFAIPRHDDGDRVLFAGRLLPLKGVMDLIRATSAVAKSQEVELVLAGSLNEQHYVNQLRKEVLHLGISDNVHFRGLLNEEQLREELGRCAVLVLPSYQETAPMVIVEAMAAGVPVIASNVGGIPYQVRNGETGFLINPGDVGALTERLVMLLSNNAMRQSFGSAAKLLAASEYQADRVVDKTISVYREIIS